ncbi:hypothetical protein F5X99DRAFT_99126 [Biscogniauxia marginata]|nr:hypothetical protein F5X99DRAFT_99126 [Biscogniauxia marginata]
MTSFFPFFLVLVLWLGWDVARKRGVDCEIAGGMNWKKVRLSWGIFKSHKMSGGRPKHPSRYLMVASPDQPTSLGTFCFKVHANMQVESKGAKEGPESAINGAL